MTRRTFTATLVVKGGSVNLLLNGAGDLGRADTDKAEVLGLLAWVFRTDVS